MGPSLMIHVLAGGAGILSGFVALYSSKGSPVHRRVGMVFACAMLVTCSFGLVIAVVRNTAPAINVPAALLTSSLVVTALTTVRPPTRATRALDNASTLVCLAVGAASLRFAWEAVAAGGVRNGMPAFPFFMFGFVSLIAAAGDITRRRSSDRPGSLRLARHLWRMCFALFVASLSFFIGQSDVFPERIRVMPLLALPVVTVLVSMLYWLWRVRVRRSLRGLIRGSTLNREPA